MKHFFLCLILLCFSFHAEGKKNLHSKKGWLQDGTADQRCIMASAGYYPQNFNSLNTYVLRSGNKSFAPFLYGAGANMVVPVGGRSGEWKGSLGAEIFIPQKITQNDSLQFKLGGLHIITSWYAHDFLPGNAHLALELAPGVDWGIIKFTQTINGRNFNSSNPFVAPLARTEFRIVFHPIAFGIRAVYRYDITSPRWRDDIALSHTRISGFGFQVFLGWGKTV
ncbi:MAG: hypothetical protein HY064_10535 [Bacteroidetes bacterium]|nr:hypothetical protein [Bacteroidota bacterium]